jgi:glycosyltransferase involved in cell wall biosynthesis
MKIVIVTTFFPPHVGGLEVIAQQQAETLTSAGHEVCVITGRHSRELASSEWTEEGYRIIRLPVFNAIENRTGIPYPIIGISAIKTYWRECGTADYIHVHDTFYLTSQIASLIATMRHRPLHVTQHVGIVEHPNRAVMMVQSFIYKAISSHLWKSAETVTVYNSHVRDFLRNRGVDKNKILETYNGIDIRRFKPVSPGCRRELRESLGLAVDRPLVLFVGRLVPKKGYLELLAAASPEFDILVVGPGKQPESYPDTVHFLGSIDRREILALYQACDIFALPSDGELFTLAMQEAMACGLPIVTTNDSRYEDYDLDRSLIQLVDRQPEAIREAILRVISDPNLAMGMADYGRHLAMTRFDWHRHGGSSRA